MACRLTVINGPDAGQGKRFHQATIWLGRDPRCDWAFDPHRDRVVSARHAEIRRDSAGYSVSDHSANGTFVNGERVDGHVALSSGDEIELGKGGPLLRFAAVTTTVQRVADAALSGPEVPTDASERGTLLRIALERDGQSWEFDGPLVRIGRDPSSDLALDPQSDLLVSFNHAKISVIAGRPTLFDLDSTNGTFLDGIRVARHELTSGSSIELGPGGPTFCVSFRESVGPPTERAKAYIGADTFFDSTEALRHLSLGYAKLLGEYDLGPELVVGRDADCPIVLDSMYVSKRHASIVQQGGGVQLRDLGSANGVFVDGRRVQEVALRPGAEFVIGPYLLKRAPQSILVFDTRTRAWVHASDLRRVDRDSGAVLLDRVSFSVEPGEFICVLGPSGSGKSTLLNCLNGHSRADEGRVVLNNIDFYANYQQLRNQVGFVPQDDIIHPQLTVEQTLSYAGRLRLPSSTSAAERRERVDDVLSVLELQDHRKKTVSDLSGGQRKRVSIAVELLSEPAILYLDEPTSGLDPNLGEKMMVLLRDLTVRGKTVVAVTHTLDHISLADKVAFLVGGRLAYFGTPQHCQQFFDVEALSDIYKRFGEQDRDRLVANFEASPAYRTLVRGAAPAASQGTTGKERRTSIWDGTRQLWILTHRYLELITRDVRHGLILLLQAPLVALFIAGALDSDQPARGPTSTVFLAMSLAALWFGCASAARELTKERSVYARERMVNLRVIPYVASKFVVLQLVALLQVGLMLMMVHWLRQGYAVSEPPEMCVRWGLQACQQPILSGIPGSLGRHLLNLYLTAVAGIGLGLVISAVAGNSDKAMSLVPLLLIPQLLFSGAFGLARVDQPIQRALGYTSVLNWSLDQAKRTAMCTPEQERGADGCSRCVHAYDPAKYRSLPAEAQLEDAVCEAVIPALGVMAELPEALRVVEDGLYTPRSLHHEGPARLAHASSRSLWALAAIVLLLFAFACILVRRADRRWR